MHTTRTIRSIVSLSILTWFGVAAMTQASSVENYVSVSANSNNANGTAVIHSQTIVNGKVIENVTRTGTDSIEYHSTPLASDQATIETAATASVATTTAAERAALQTLITKLHQYVALLTQLLQARATR